MRAVVRNPDRAAGLRGMANVELFPGDLSQRDTLRGCAEGCSQVFHCAAKLTGSDRAAFHAINVTGTQALINESDRANVERFIYASTIGVYGFSEAENISEEFPWPKCDWHYITTKQEAERVVWATAGRMPIVVARFGDVMGPGQYVWTINFIEKINQGLMRPPTDSASGILNPVYIDNLVDALLLMSAHPAAPGQAFNVVDGTPIRASDYIRRLTQMAGKRTSALLAIVLKGATTLLVWKDLLRGREASDTLEGLNYLLRKATISADKIRRLLGWTPAVTQEEAFRRTEQWLRQNGYLSPA